MDVKMNRARAGRGRIRGLGSPEERCLGQSRWLPRGADAQLSLERQTAPSREQAGSSRQGDQHEPRPETVSTRPREGHEAALGPRMFTGGSPDGGAVRSQYIGGVSHWASFLGAVKQRGREKQGAQRGRAESQTVWLVGQL